MEIEKKQFTYRGKKTEELKEISVREFAKFAHSRVRRSILRQFQDIEKFVTSMKKKESRGKPIRTHKRYIPIVPHLIGMKIQVYNGKTFIPVQITEEMLGYRLGDFALTRGKVKHSSAGIGATKGSKFKAKK